MEIGGETVGEGVYYIAEAGVNHAGDPERARRLIDAASEAGADAVKFQTFDPESLVAPEAAVSSYQADRTDAESQRELLERYDLDRETYRALADHAREQGVHFLSSPFDPASADLLRSLDVPAVKIGSGELTNHPLLRHVARFDRPMICSTGMATMDEVRAAYDVIRTASGDSTDSTDPTGTNSPDDKTDTDDTNSPDDAAGDDSSNRPDVIFLHCVSAYPTEPGDVNLAAMEQLDDAFDVPVGFSDHTTDAETPAMAVACGATVVEKHFTLDRSLPGPDQAASLEPDELAASVTLARRAARVRGTPRKRPVAAERENRVVARKGVYATRRLAPGDRIAADDVAVLRPAEGLPPTVIEQVIGSRVAEPIPAETAITADALDATITVTGVDPFPDDERESDGSTGGDAR